MGWKVTNTCIVCDREVMFGKPTVRGTRITVEHILRMAAGGHSELEIVDQHPRLTIEDVRAAFKYAADDIAPWRIEAAE
ncbi:DUF433 domain-containing protein [Chelativorans sp.]|uniref:DUF433 domain-containing protein n=1 Tax=Chelativorans sp. TaxID=2203393 RepID=UPI0028113869|nr:DUF433 domain-containing protein [Chelativorans sp.]